MDERMELDDGADQDERMFAETQVSVMIADLSIPGMNSWNNSKKKKLHTQDQAVIPSRVPTMNSAWSSQEPQYSLLLSVRS